MSIYDDPAYAEFLKAYTPEPAAPTTSKKDSKTYWSDMPTKAAMGILGLGKMGVNAAVGNDNSVYDFLESEIARGRAELSPEQRRQDAEVAKTMADDDKGMWDVATSMVSNPRASAGMIAESLPGMFVGGGIGGLLARGAAGFKGAAVGRLGTLAAAGVGQGTIMGADVFDKTGSGVAALEALALGTATGFIPGVEAGLTRKYAGNAVEGIKDVLVPGMAKAGAFGVAKRTGAAVGAEGAQEFVEETGQALIEQGGKGEELNLRSAMKQGVAGAVVGGVMGGGMHPLAGEGSKAAELAAAEKVLTKDPTNPVAQAEVALLRAQRDYVEAAPEQRDALKPAIDVAKAAVVAARNPDSRDAADKLDTARAEAVVDTAGKAGAQVAADMISAEGQRAIAESATVDEAIHSVAGKEQAHSTVTLGVQGVQNVRAGAVVGVTTAIQDEVARVKETQLASTTANEAEFPVEVVATTPKVSDTIGLTRDTPAEVAAATPLPVLDPDRLGAEMTTQAVANPDLPTINAETLKGQVTSAMTQVDDTLAEEQVKAELEMDRAGFGPERVRAMRSASTGELNRQVMDPASSPAQANFARILLQRSNITTDQKVLDARANLDREIEAVAQQRSADVGTIRTAVGNLGITSAQSILDNPGSRDHAVVRALAALRGWQLNEPATPAAEVEAEEGTLTAEMVRQLYIDDFTTMRGAPLIPTSMRDAVIEDAPQVVTDLMFEFENRRLDAGDSISDIAEELDGMLAWLTSEEGVETGVSERGVTFINGIQKIMGLETETEDVSAALNDELAAELAPLPINDEIAELEAIADDENVADEQRAEARASARSLRQERDAGITANRPSAPSMAAARAAYISRGQSEGYDLDQVTHDADAMNAYADAHLESIAANVGNRYWPDTVTLAQAILASRANQPAPAPAPAARRTRGQPVTQPGIRSVQTAFDTRAREAHRDGTLTKLGKFWKSLMSARNVGQRVLPKIDTSDLKAAARLAVRNATNLPQDLLEQVRSRYNAKLKEMATQWAADNNKPMAPWVDPIRSISPSSRQGFGITLYGLGRGGEENPYAIRPGRNFTSFSADSTLHAVSLEDAPGSADLAYRLAAEIGTLRGKGFPSDTILSTVNNLRRQLQSMSADTMFAPGVINPLIYDATQGPQGISGERWRAAGNLEKIGLNALRATHSITVNRPNGRTGGAWLENLVFDRQGRIIAFTDPKPQLRLNGSEVSGFGFPRGTIVTPQMLEDKIGEVNPATGFKTYETRSEGTGGIGADTARLAILNNTILKEIEDKPDAEIPSWIGTLARAKGREQGGWFFSETDTAPAAGMTKAEAENVVRDVVGDTAAKVLLDTGIVSFVETPAELADLGGVPLSSVARGVQGVTMPDGRIVLVTGNLTTKNAAAVLQHEALHATLKGLVGEDTYNRLMSRLDTLVQAGAGAQWVADAKAAVPKKTPAENVTEEIAAYAVEQYVKNPESDNPLVRWARDLMSAIRSAIIQNKTLPEALRVWAIQNVQPQDFARMAIAGLKRSAVTAGPARNSERDFQGEIESLMAEHAMPDTTNERRAEINEEVRNLNKFRNAEADLAYEKGRTNESADIRGEAAGVPAQAEYGIPIGGAVSVEATHFSNAERGTLNTSAYGTGLKGEEAGRLAEPGNADIRERTHFYVDEGTGLRPEAGVGSVAHNVKLNNLYNIKADPAGYRKLNRENSSAMERAIVQAGYDGYYAPEYSNGMGVAVVIGQHAIPVSPGAGGVNAAPLSEADSYVAQIAASKLPAGSMLGREWSVALKNHELGTENVMRELENRQDQRIYRDDLIRFNKPSNGKMRFSIAQEIDAATSPVAPPPAPRNELNILGNSQRPPLERMMETVASWLVDKHVTLGRIQKLAGVTAEQMELDTIGALHRLGSKMSSTQKRLVKIPLGRIEGILQASYKGEVDAGEKAHKDINDLLIALHAPEYNGRMATINPLKLDARGNYASGYDLADHPGSGIKTAEANADRDRLLEGKHGEALQKAVVEYRKMINDLQDYAVERGLENAAVVEAWRNPETGFPNYTPFHRELDLEENHGIGTARGAQGFSIRTGITQRAMGSSQKIFDPLASTLILGTRIVSRGENAVVARTMFAFAKGLVPNYVNSARVKKPMWKVDIVPQTRVIKNTNVYRVRLADGSQSAEFYNREQSRLYADAQEAAFKMAWEKDHSGVPMPETGIISEFITTAERVFIQDQPNHLNQENIMVIPVEGENHIIEFDENSEDAMALLNALKGKHALGGGKAMKVMNTVLTPFRMFSRWTVAMATGFNPIFSVFNSARDVQGAMLNAKDGGIPGWEWADSRGIAKDFFPAAKGIWSQLAAEFSALHGNTGAAPDPAKDSWAWWMKQAESSGGLTGVMEHITEPEDALTMVRRLYGSKVESDARGVPDDWLTKTNTAFAKVGDAFYRLGEGETQGKMRPASIFASATSRLNTAGELATRTAVFKRATEKYMEQGHSEADAMQMAAVVSKNISTNFNRRGNISTFLNQLFPFFNAAVQGSARMAEALFKKDTYTIKDGDITITDQKTDFLTPYGKKVIGSLAGLGALQAALLAMAGFEDDEPPEAIKDRAFIIPLPGEGKNYMAIPMPHGFNTLINMGREMTDMAFQAAQGNGMKAGAHFLRGTIGQAAAFNPLGGQGNLLLGIMPALADPAVAIYTNEDVFGRKIAREDMNQRDVTPGFTRTKEGGSPWGRSIAQGLNRMSGGNEDQKGFISPTGDQIDYLFGELGGGLTREVLKGGRAVIQGANYLTGTPQEELPVSKIPLIGRIFGNAASPTGIRSRAFEISADLNSLDNRYKGLLERGEKAEAKAFKAEHPELSLVDDFNRFYREDSKAKKQRALSRDSDEIEKVNKITETQTEKARKLTEKYDALK